MAKLIINLTQSKPRFVGTGTAPTGGYKFRIDEVEVRDNENNDGKNILLRVELIEGTNADGVGAQQQFVVFPATEEPPVKPADGAPDEEKKAYRMAKDNNDKFFGYCVSIGLPEDKLKAKKVTVDTDNWPGKEGYVYIEPAVDRDGRPRQDFMSAQQFAAMMAGKLKINPRLPKEEGGGKGGSGGRKGSGGGKAEDIADDLDEIEGGGKTSGGGTAGKSGATGAGGKAGGGASGAGKGGSKPGGDLGDVEL